MGWPAAFCVITVPSPKFHSMAVGVTPLVFTVKEEDNPLQIMLGPVIDVIWVEAKILMGNEMTVVTPHLVTLHCITADSGL